MHSPKAPKTLVSTLVPLYFPFNKQQQFKALLDYLLLDVEPQDTKVKIEPYNDFGKYLLDYYGPDGRFPVNHWAASLRPLHVSKTTNSCEAIHSVLKRTGEVTSSDPQVSNLGKNRGNPH